jgi:hypothetical protein
MKLYNLLIILFFTPHLHAAVTTGSLTPSRDGQTDQSTQTEIEPQKHSCSTIFTAICDKKLAILKAMGANLAIRKPGCQRTAAHFLVYPEHLEEVIASAPELLFTPDKNGEICLHVFAKQTGLIAR